MKKIFYVLFMLLTIITISACDETSSFDATKKINIYTRDSSSGTRDGFFTGIDFEDAKADNTKLASGFIEVESNGDMINKVKADDYGIGYISLASYKSNELKGLYYNGVEPTEENVISGKYRLTRNFNYVTRDFIDEDTSEAKIVKAFVAYMATKEGKTTIKSKSGIVDIKDTDPTWESIKGDYPIPTDASNVTIKFGGSTSVQSVAEALSNEFSSIFGNFKVEHNHTGSSDAYKNTQGEGKDGASSLHVGFASREFKSTETGEEGTQGTLAIDAIVAVVNRNNTRISKVDETILKDIFSGTITIWNELNDSDNKLIMVYTRDTSSGTRDGFFTGIEYTDAIKDNTKLAPGFIEVSGNGDMINKVKSDEFGIGYISLASYASSGLKGIKFDNVDPTEANVISGDYKLTRNFNYITKDYTNADSSEAKIVKALQAYMTTKEGKLLIQSQDGIVDILDNDPLWDTIRENHPIPEDAANITIKVGGSTSVEKIAKALTAEFSPLFGNFKVEHNHTGSGDAYKNTQGSGKDGATALHIGFASREFKAEEAGVEGTFGKIAIDAIVVVVNQRNNTVSNLSKEQLKSIFSGSFAKWGEIK